MEGIIKYIVVGKSNYLLCSLKIIYTFLELGYLYSTYLTICVEDTRRAEGNSLTSYPAIKMYMYHISGVCV